MVRHVQQKINTSGNSLDVMEACLKSSETIRGSQANILVKIFNLNP